MRESLLGKVLENQGCRFPVKVQEPWDNLGGSKQFCNVDKTVSMSMLLSLNENIHLTTNLGEYQLKWGSLSHGDNMVNN